jgi:hypothetical protein
MIRKGQLVSYHLFCIASQLVSYQEVSISHLVRKVNVQPRFADLSLQNVDLDFYYLKNHCRGYRIF